MKYVIFNICFLQFWKGCYCFQAFNKYWINCDMQSFLKIQMFKILKIMKACYRMQLCFCFFLIFLTLTSNKWQCFSLAKITMWLQIIKLMLCTTLRYLFLVRYILGLLFMSQKFFNNIFILTDIIQSLFHVHI